MASLVSQERAFEAIHLSKNNAVIPRLAHCEWKSRAEHLGKSPVDRNITMKYRLRKHDLTVRSCWKSQLVLEGRECEIGRREMFEKLPWGKLASGSQASEATLLFDSSMLALPINAEQNSVKQRPHWCTRRSLQQSCIIAAVNSMLPNKATADIAERFPQRLLKNCEGSIT